MVADGALDHAGHRAALRVGGGGDTGARSAELRVTGVGVLVLHGVWAGDGVAVWAEDSGAAARGPGPDASSHPFAAPGAALRAAVAA
ncbi:hypothetical protein DEF24_24040, partial [Marinitenerispora sediminis]